MRGSYVKVAESVDMSLLPRESLDALSSLLEHLEDSWEAASSAVLCVVHVVVGCCRVGCEQPSWSLVSGAVHSLLDMSVWLSSSLRLLDVSGVPSGLSAASRRLSAAEEMLTPFGSCLAEQALPTAVEVWMLHLESVAGFSSAASVLAPDVVIECLSKLADAQSRNAEELERRVSSVLAPNSGAATRCREWAKAATIRWLVLTGLGYVPGAALDSVMSSIPAPWWPHQ